MFSSPVAQGSLRWLLFVSRGPSGVVFVVGFFQGWQICPKAAESSAVGVLGSWEREQHRLRGVKIYVCVIFHMQVGRRETLHVIPCLIAVMP